MVIGLEEPILIKGIGKLNAKIDSGNGGYNVIHGKNFTQQGDVLSFETEDSEGNKKHVSKRIKQVLSVNIGGGHIQERPVIELDVQFAGDTYKKILFSVTDRSDNEHKVLISKDFVGKELSALIDVTKNNIGNDDVNVEYVSEGWIWNTVKGIGKGAKATVMGSETLGKWKDKSERFKKSMVGQGASPSTSKKEMEIKSGLEEEIEAMGKLADVLSSDAELIRKKLPEIEADIEEAEIDVSVTGDDVSIYKIIDYTGNTNYNDVKADPEFKKRTEKVIEKIKKEKKKQGDKNIKESTEPENNEEDDDTENNDSSETPDNDTNNTETPTGKPENTNEPDVNDLSPEELESYKQDILARKRFIFYYLSFNKKKSDGSDLPNAEKYFADGSVKESIATAAKSIITSQSYDVKNFENISKNISLKITAADQNAAGVFVLCTGNRTARRTDFITRFLIGAANEQNKKNKVIKKLRQIYEELNNGFKEAIGDNSQELSDESIKKQTSGKLYQYYQILSEQFKKIASQVGFNGDLSTSAIEHIINKLNTKTKKR